MCNQFLMFDFLWFFLQSQSVIIFLQHFELFDSIVIFFWDQFNLIFMLFWQRFQFEVILISHLFHIDVELLVVGLQFLIDIMIASF